MISGKILIYCIINVVLIVFSYLIYNVEILGSLPSNNLKENSSAIYISPFSGILLSDFDQKIYWYDYTTGILINVFQFGSKIKSMFVTPDRFAWVTNSAQNYISAIDLNSGIETQTETGNGPCSAAFDGDCLWVTNSASGTVTSVTTGDFKIQKIIDIGLNPTHIAYDGYNNLWVCVTGEKQIKIIDNTNGGVISKNFYVGDFRNSPIKVFYDKMNTLWILNDYGKIESITATQNKDKTITYKQSVVFQLPLALYTEMFVSDTSFYVGQSNGSFQAYSIINNSLQFMVKHSDQPIDAIVTDKSTIYVFSQGAFKSYDLFGNILRTFDLSTSS